MKGTRVNLTQSISSGSLESIKLRNIRAVPCGAALRDRDRARCKQVLVPRRMDDVFDTVTVVPRLLNWLRRLRLISPNRLSCVCSSVARAVLYVHKGGNHSGTEC